MGGRWIEIGMAVVLVGAPLAARADDPPAPASTPALAGAAAWARVVGNTVTGTTPDGPYSELFAPDGTLTIVDNDGKADGRWALKGDKICTRVDDEEEECRAVEAQGADGAFVDEGGTRYPFTILPGNPKGL
ncbi:hypothetical protein D3273_15010 [Lichenibacterium minor]|uniref:DUF995 domain-containing protein n=1 Tax=Lichenibacterium minor TaxID=2316528 RepID=A0A4Q2U4M7_9HYPH|nr:hypothetical protein [Lichenibacterium minor]RYC31200.1 hypothetical protein D3273_15010 [Lichenibacterium minor]